MRELLFRGKVLGRDRWVFGYPLIFRGYQIFDIIDEVFIDVTSFTIGECTGLTDKNGQKIFEGDILKHQVFKHESTKYYTVEFVDGSFGMRDSKGWFVSFRDGVFGPNMDEYEVAGNIHDNPELLKRKKV